VDVIMSNCVINLSPDKGRVFREAWRVLRPGGRLAISDVVAIGEMPDAMKENPAAYCGCVGGAIPVVELEAMLSVAGFRDVTITVQEQSREFIQSWLPGSGAERVVRSAAIEAKKGDKS
ncbi:methyltransferase domain-containing protein, partial [bacterium]|nr:methyltransferase domain-containing protein [bacterium]